MATYPLSSLSSASVDLLNQAAILKNYRDGGYVQATAVVKDGNLPKRSMDVGRQIRALDMSTVKSNTSLGGATPSFAIADVLQIAPVSPGDVIIGAVLRVTRAAGGVCNLNIGTAGGSNLFSNVSAAATGTFQVMLTSPIYVSADDTVDLTFAASTVNFDAAVELELIVVPAR